MGKVGTADYVSACRAAKSLNELKAVLDEYDPISAEGREKVESMTDADFDRFIEGAVKESKATYAGDDWAEEFGDVLMPTIFLPICSVANQFGVTDGLAIRRLIDIGVFEMKDNGRIFWTEFGMNWWIEACKGTDMEG